MIRISKLTDYATVLLAALAREPAHCFAAAALARQTQIGAATVDTTPAEGTPNPPAVAELR